MPPPREPPPPLDGGNAQRGAPMGMRFLAIAFEYAVDDVFAFERLWRSGGIGAP